MGPSDAATPEAPRKITSRAAIKLSDCFSRLPQGLSGPESRTAQCRDEMANVARPETVMAVPTAIANVPSTPAQNKPWPTEKISRSNAPVQGRMPIANAIGIALRHDHAPAASRGLGICACPHPQAGP